MATRMTTNGVSTTTTPGTEQYEVFYTGYRSHLKKHYQCDYRHTDGELFYVKLSINYSLAWQVHSKSADNAVMNGLTRKSTTQNKIVMDNQVAKIILQQIGGRRFVAMTGSHDFINLGNGLRMSLSRNKTSANRLEIIYDEGADLYDLRFYRQSMNHKTFEVKTKDIKKIDGVYCDMLEDIFTDVTGLYTRF